MAQQGYPNQNQHQNQYPNQNQYQYYADHAASRGWPSQPARRPEVCADFRLSVIDISEPRGRLCTSYAVVGCV